MALDAATGKVRWYYQTIHHDLWDRDIPCPPITTGRQRRRCLVSDYKDDLVYVLDRDSGTSLFPVPEEAIPFPQGLPANGLR